MGNYNVFIQYISNVYTLTKNPFISGYPHVDCIHQVGINRKRQMQMEMLTLLIACTAYS